MGNPKNCKVKEKSLRSDLQLLGYVWVLKNKYHIVFKAGANNPVDPK